MDLANGFVGDRFVVDPFEGDEFVGKKAKDPASAPVGRLAGREGDEMSFVFTVEFTVVFAVGVPAMNRCNPSVSVAFACAVGS